MSGPAFILLSDVAGPVIPAATAAPTITGLIADRLKQTLSWKTDVIDAPIGLEKRQGIRGAPRERWELEYVIDQTIVEALRASLMTQRAQTLRIPAMHVPLSPLSAIISNTFSVDTSYVDTLHVNDNGGDPLLIVNTAGQAYLANVTAVSSGTPGIITVTVDVVPPPGQVYGADSYIYTAKSIVIDDGQKLGRYRISKGTLAISGAVKTPTTAPTGTGGTLVTFDSLPVLDRQGVQDGMSVVAEQVQLGLEMLDQGGVFSMRTLQTFAMQRRPLELLISSATDRQWLIKLLQTLLGRQGLFLLPTWRADLSLHTQPSVGATSLLIDSTPDYVNVWFPSAAHRRLQLAHADGSVEYAKVITAMDNGNGTQTLGLAAGVSGTAIAMMSLLEQCRLDSDDVEITWEATCGHVPLVGVVVQQ